MSIKNRLIIWFTLSFGLLVIALSIAAYFVMRAQAYSKLDAALQVATGATAMSAEHELEEHSDLEGGEKDLQSVLDKSGSLELQDTQILVRHLNRNAAYKPAPGAIDLRTIPTDRLQRTTDLPGLRLVHRALWISGLQTSYEIVAAKPTAGTLEQLKRIRILLVISVPLGLALAAVGGAWLARRSLAPLDELAGIVDAVTSSDLSARVVLKRERDEIGRLGLRFNALLDRLEQAFTFQRRFMADAAHQIRTPLTVALTAVQVANRDSALNLNDCKDLLQTVEKQILQLRRIVEDMFFLSQTDTASLKFERAELYLDEVIEEAAASASALSQQKQQTLKVNTFPEARCLGDQDLIKQALLILLDNAVKFTPAGGSIEVTLSQRAQQWICSVTDSGVGIRKADQPRVFERFFRGTCSTADARSGAGLGLAIARSILENHGGSLLLVESSPGRTIFEITLPALDQTTGKASTYANSSAVRI